MRATNSEWGTPKRGGRRFSADPGGEHQAQGYPTERTRAETDFIVQALALSPSARVLDIPCGEGRHSIELAARNFAPTAVDFSERALAVAERNARERGVHVDFVRADMREFTALETGSFTAFKLGARRLSLIARR